MCNVKIFTVGEEYIISRRNEIHNHQDNQAKLNTQIINASVKRKAMDDISERPSKLIHSVLNENGKVSTILLRINIYNSTF
jgi:hypothetical protein